VETPYGYLYLVRCVNGKLYVGQTIKTVEYRWQQHIRSAESGLETYLSRAIRKYGRDAFTVETLATCADLETLNKLEHYFIKYVFQSTNELLGYNLKGGGDSIGSHSEETRVKMSAWQTGRKLSTEHRKNISAARRTPEAIAKFATIYKGRKLSEETKAKIAAAHKGRKLTAEHKAKVAAANRGRKHSPETLEKMSVGRKNLSPTALANMSAAQKRRWAKYRADKALEAVTVQ
jgi:group I intron endonuclease